MTSNQIKTHLAQVFEQDYQGYDSFVRDVIDIIFMGEDAYEALPVPEDFLTDGNRQRANASGILQIHKVGTVNAEEPIDLFDITLSDKKELQYNRVGIQQFIRSTLFPFTNAFMLFHNETTEGKDWRFSYAYKETTIKGMTPAKRYTYLFGKNHRARTASERFAKLAGEEKSTQNLLSAFSVEALSKSFFDEYKGQYDIFCKFLFDHKNDTEYFGSEFTQWEDKFLRDYVKKMMGRITFIYFLQRKGWMNGNMEYMQKAFEQSPYQDNYLDAFLEPLFFGVLNTKPEERKALFENEGWALSLLDEWKDVPYLNGGLFERDEQDEPKSKFPDELFKGLFEFYSRYNFTIDENDPDDAEVGVDPEMLGHIFENLLEDNKDKGAFYTPKEIVQYMSQESIAQYLKTHTEEALHPAIDELIKEKKVNELLQNKAVASAVYALLQEVKVCDPAIGSGAFPMGVLNVLYHARLLLYGFTKPTHEFSPSEVKREIIQNNIYGVDIEKGAIDIARLRFWLSIVVDSEQPEALPNFDYKFMQGNSLLEEFGGIDLSSLQNQVMQTTVYEPQRDLFGNVEDNQMKMTFTQQETVDNLQANLEKYFDIDDHTQKQAVKEEISNSVKDHISYNIELRRDQCLCLIQEANEAISDEESQIEDIKTRFPEDKMPESEIRKHEKKISDLKRVIDRNNIKVHHYDLVSHELETIDLTSNESFFLWHTWFKDVFDNGGFDVVIGNPPYIRPHHLDEETKQQLWRYYSTYEKKADIYVCFLERAIKLAKTKGVITFIVSDGWLRLDSFEKLRLYLLKETDVNQIVDFTKDVFDSATVKTCILSLTKGLTPNHQLNSAIIDDKVDLENIEFNRIPQSVFDTTYKHVFDLSIESTSMLLKEHIKNKSIPLEKKFSLSFGLKTGDDEKYLTFNPMVSPHCKKLLRGANVNRWIIDFKGEYVIYLPEEMRKNKSTARPGNKKRFEQPKVLVRDTGGGLMATYDNDSYYVKDVIIIEDEHCNESILKVLAALLNSKTLRWYYETSFPTLHVQRDELASLPIPKSVFETELHPIINFVDQILSAKKENPQADTREMEQKIDLLVYHLYGLTYEEVLIVDPETPITKEKYVFN